MPSEVLLGGKGAASRNAVRLALFLGGIALAGKVGEEGSIQSTQRVIPSLREL